MHRRLLPILAALLCLLGCQPAANRADPGPTTPAPRSTTAPTSISQAATQSPQASAPVPTVAPPLPSPSPTACAYGRSTRLAELQERAVEEASGLTFSRRNPGVYWTLNDSGNQPILYAFGLDGRSRGTLRLDGARNVDWEALHVGPGAGGEPALYVADIGDNQAARREVVVYRVSEPPLGDGAAKPASTTQPAEAMTLTYPDGPRDAEALLIHPQSGELLIVSKSYAGAGRIYRLPRPFAPGQRATLERAADIDLSSLGPLAGAVTDAAVSPDGRKVSVRTYVAAIELDLPPGASLASIWANAPRISRLDDRQQGEGITYRADGGALLTIGEGRPAVVWQSEWRC